MKVYDKNLKAHKITNTFYLIIIIPFLLLSILSVVIMINAKNAGGYANIFGYYVVELEDNHFYNSQTGEYKSGTKQMFKATSYENLKSGDIVVCYSGESTSDPIYGESSPWMPIPANMSFSLSFENTTAENSPVKIVKIGPAKKIVTDNNGNEYTMFSFYESNNGPLIEDVSKLILGDDIIGVAIPSSAFLANTIDYAKTTGSLLFLVLLPCALLLMIKFMSLSFYKKYEKQTSMQRSGRFVDEERMSYSQVINANRARGGAPQRPTRVSAVRPQSSMTRQSSRPSTSNTTRSYPTQRTPPKRPTSPPQRPTRKQ